MTYRLVTRSDFDGLVGAVLLRSLELIDEIADQLGTGVEIARDALDAIESDPAGRVAIGVFQLLDMADRDPIAAAAGA